MNDLALLAARSLAIVALFLAPAPALADPVSIGLSLGASWAAGLGTAAGYWGALAFAIANSAFGRAGARARRQAPQP